MAALFRVVKNLGKIVTLQSQNRNISVSGATYIAEIVEKKEGNTTIVECVIKPDKNDGRLMKIKSDACPLCATGLDLKHTDVLILSQFTRSDGCILPRRITGLCEIQQKRISSMIIMAQNAGLLPIRGPKGDLLPPFQRRKWRKFNTYYDEKTIKARYNNV